MHDIGLTHVALTVSDLTASVAFWEKYPRMRVVHRRPDVVWLNDGKRAFVIVLIEVKNRSAPLTPDNHLGVALNSREEVDEIAALAKEEGFLVSDPQDSGPVVGYWCYLRDPDGHTLELSYGQDVAQRFRAPVMA